MSIKARIAVIIVGIAAIILGTYGGYRIYEKDQQTASIHERQQGLQSRIDALRSAMKIPTNDPAEIQARKDRLTALQKDLDSLKSDVGSGAKN